MQKLIKLTEESRFTQLQMEAEQEVSFKEFIQHKNRLQCDCESQGQEV